MSGIWHRAQHPESLKITASRPAGCFAYDRGWDDLQPPPPPHHHPKKKWQIGIATPQECQGIVLVCLRTSKILLENCLFGGLSYWGCLNFQILRTEEKLFLRILTYLYMVSLFHYTPARNLTVSCSNSMLLFANLLLIKRLFFQNLVRWNRSGKIWPFEQENNYHCTSENTKRKVIN